MEDIKGIDGINVLITSVGGLVSPGIIKNVAKIPEVSRIIGVDASSRAIGFFMVDKGYVVPKGDEAGYMDALWSIIKAESVNLIIPASDEEVLTLSSHQMSLREEGIFVLCPPFDIVFKMIDKGSMLRYLGGKGLPVPEFYLPKTKKDIIQAAKVLGYPRKSIVAKPRRGRGGRGVIIVKENGFQVLNARESIEMKLEWLLDIVSEEEIPKMVLVEYLPGDEYSVDILADRGQLLFVVPRKRIRAILGPSQLGEIDWNGEVINIIKNLVRVCEFHSVTNIQLKYSCTKNLVVTEINPRISGTIVLSTAAGVNLLQEGMRHVFGLKPTISPMNRPNSVRMIRYLKEYFF